MLCKEHVFVGCLFFFQICHVSSKQHGHSLHICEYKNNDFALNNKRLLNQILFKWLL